MKKTDSSMPAEGAHRTICQLIDERDRAYEVIDKLCDEVLGPDRPEWSSAYGFADAVEDVAERIADVRSVLDMVETNAAVRAGEPRRAWNGDHLRKKVQRLIALLAHGAQDSHLRREQQERPHDH